MIGKAGPGRLWTMLGNRHHRDAARGSKFTRR
jgi:hypothetical protein